jgi:putative protease
MPELLAPAGNLEKLKWAVTYGADAVYFGLEFGSLRSFAGNFTLEDAEKGIQFLHKKGKKGYVTLNIYPFSDEYDRLIGTACRLDEMGADGLIISDLGLLSLLKKRKLRTPLHISTQANSTSWQTVAVYKELGASRVNLARELSLRQTEEIQKNLHGRIDTEVFIHGAVCFSYSGRCAISDYMTGYRANRGECKHPCRYQYYLVEEKRPGKYMPVFEDNRGLYFFNSKDLALFEYIPALSELGVAAFKIEGRMKSIHYIASVVSLYRRLLDGEPITNEQALSWLNRVPNRGYTAGFIKGSFQPEDYSWDQSVSAGTSRFVANVTESRADGCTIRVRNTIRAGETLEVLQPGNNLSDITMPVPLQTAEGKSVDFAQSDCHLLLPFSLPEYTILRRVRPDSD